MRGTCKLSLVESKGFEYGVTVSPKLTIEL